LPPEVTPPATIRTPGPGEIRSQLQAVRVALNANALEDFSLHREQLEALISEARAEGIADAIKLLEEPRACPRKSVSG
jgi:hypothetical protein